jgi:hypothetical protein
VEEFLNPKQSAATGKKGGNKDEGKNSQKKGEESKKAE